MFAPSAELVRRYSETIVSAADEQDRRVQELIRDYILANLSPDLKTGRRRRVMMLLFSGEEAVRKIRSVIGNISAGRRGGETGRRRPSHPAVLHRGRRTATSPRGHGEPIPSRYWLHTVRRLPHQGGSGRAS